MPQIDIINGIPGSSFTRDLSAQVPAFQAFADLVSAAWGLEPTTLHYAANVRRADPSHWWLVVNNRSDMVGAGGYHNQHPGGLPFGRVFFGDAIREGFSPTVDLTHELAEMMKDPWVESAPALWADGQGRQYLVEIGDPVEEDQFGFEVQGVLCSDFVLPAYYGGSAGPFDYAGHLSRPCPALLTGGYVSWLELDAWQQKFAALLGGGMSRRAARWGRTARAQGRGAPAP